ncbi:hypothetical protein PWT90_07694 [Aphanocladium album]|nr:hypothetical protein PWT90_07694 [Aphanocladium album]
MCGHPSVPAPGLTTLPNELLDIILEDLDFDDWAALASTSTSLLRQMEQHLLATQQQRDRTLICAARLGYAVLVRYALYYGASAQAPFVPSRKCSRDGPRLNPVLVLRLAVKGGNEAAFQLLVNDGASVEAFINQAEKSNMSRVGIDYGVDGLLWLLSCPNRVGFLRHFCEGGKLPPLRPEHLQKCLRYTVKRSLINGIWPDETVNLLVASGADVCELQSDKARGKCPVALAILRGHAHIAEELLRLGANIHGKQLACGEKLEYFHIPIFAAAHRMAVEGPFVVRRFLAWGANPHHAAELRLQSRIVNDSGNFQREHASVSTPLPIYMYLASINWVTDTAFSHLEGLRFWFKLGPSFANGTIVPGDGIARMYGMHNSLHAILFQKWGPNYLANTSFYEVVKEIEPNLTDFQLREIGGKAYSGSNSPVLEAIPTPRMARHGATTIDLRARRYPTTLLRS